MHSPRAWLIASLILGCQHAGVLLVGAENPQLSLAPDACNTWLLADKRDGRPYTANGANWVELRNCIGNIGGTLVSTNTAYQESCQSCRMDDSSVLSCVCDYYTWNSDGSNVHKTSRPASIALPDILTWAGDSVYCKGPSDQITFGVPVTIGLDATTVTTAIAFSITPAPSPTKYPRIAVPSVTSTQSSLHFPADPELDTVRFVKAFGCSTLS